MGSSNAKTRLRFSLAAAVVLAGAGLATACTDRHIAGGLIGGAAVGGAYEYQNKKTLKKLDRDLHSGRISIHEYKRRRDEIDDRSLLY